MSAFFVWVNNCRTCCRGVDRCHVRSVCRGAGRGCCWRSNLWWRWWWFRLRLLFNLIWRSHELRWRGGRRTAFGGASCKILHRIPRTSIADDIHLMHHDGWRCRRRLHVRWRKRRHVGWRGRGLRLFCGLGCWCRTAVVVCLLPLVDARPRPRCLFGCSDTTVLGCMWPAMVRLHECSLLDLINVHGRRHQHHRIRLPTRNRRLHHRINVHWILNGLLPRMRHRRILTGR